MNNAAKNNNNPLVRMPALPRSLIACTSTAAAVIQSAMTNIAEYGHAVLPGVPRLMPTNSMEPRRESVMFRLA